MSERSDRIASQFFSAIERGDLETVRDLYSPGVEVWHNVTGQTQTREENLKLLGYFTKRVSELHYEILARDFFEGGFAQRHVLHGKLESGEPIAASVCLIVYLVDGRIQRLFEYLDPAAVAGAFAREP